MKRILCFVVLSVALLTPHTLFAAPVQEIKSTRGVIAWLVEDHSLPVVSVAFAWHGGIEQDSDDRQGLSHIAAAMLTHGAGADDENTFQQKLQDNAISLGFQAQRDAISGEMRSLKETLPTAQEMLRASLVEPHFDDAALSRTKLENLSALKSYQADSEWLLSRLMMRELFSGHAYARRTLGTEATVNAITRKDLREWQKHLSRSGLQISITGDMNADDARNFLDATFGQLPENVSQATIADTDIKGKKEIQLLRYKSPQSSLLLVWPAMQRKDKDWYAFEVMNYILGGGSFSSRLMKEIRDKRGLTYGISSGGSLFDHAALFTIQAACKNEKAGEVYALTLKEIARMRDEKVSAAELQAAKDYLIGSYPLSLTSTSHVAAHNLELQRHDLGMDDQQKEETGLRAVTAEDVQRVAQRILRDDSLATFLIGAPQGIVPTKTFDSVD